MIGPSIIHCHKTYESYFSLPNSRIRFEPQLLNLRGFGTERELSLLNSFKACFPKENHLLCSIHAKENISRKCEQLQINAKPYIDEIFGIKSGDIKYRT